MNRQTEFAYVLMFEIVFNLMHETTKKFVRWQHIHEEELYDIVMNMNFEQILDK